MEIHNTGGISGPDPIQPSQRPANRIRKYAESSPSVDRAEISGVDHCDVQDLVLPPERHRLVLLDDTLGKRLEGGVMDAAKDLGIGVGDPHRRCERVSQFLFVDETQFQKAGPEVPTQHQLVP